MRRMNEIVVVDDEENVLRFLTRALEKKGYFIHPAATGAEALKKLTQIEPALVITDIVLPDIDGIELLKKMKTIDPEINVILITAHASLETAISAVRNGASDYLIKPFRVDELCSVVQRALSTKRIVFDDSLRKHRLEQKYDFENFVGHSNKMCEIYQLIKKVSETEATVLITGESGTGKELVARAIHCSSKRAAKAFVSINCAALPETLLESELFGHEKGSFTGAVASKMGLLELADQGTFFFDEIGEIQPHIQVKLLRVLQEKEIRHVGGLRDIKVDARILAASARDLRVEVQKGSFREDLFYRLNVVEIHMPPLRERKEDIPILANHFLKVYSNKHGLNQGLSFEEAALDYLTNEYLWPGNVRELENLMERAVMLSDNGHLALEQIRKLQANGTDIPLKVSTVSQDQRDLRTETEGFEKRLIQSVLEETRGNKYQAAKRLQISRQSLQYKLKKHRLA